MEALAMSLDEYAKTQKSNSFQQRRGGMRRGNNNQQSRRYQPNQKGNRWDHDRFNDDFGGYNRNQNRQYRQNNDDSRTILRISNLHFSVLQEELKEMFEVYGELVKCEIDWDSFGRSEGTAVVQYLSPESSRRAVEEYNGVELDGLTLSVEIGTKDMLYKKRNNLISKNQPFKRFGGGPKYQRYNRQQNF